MTNFRRTLKAGMATAFMLAAFTAGAQGQVGDGGSFASSTLGTGELGIQIKGKVVCAQCSLAEIREAQADKWNNHLYQLVHRQGQVVIEVERVGQSRWWNNLTFPHIRVWGEDSLFAELTAEENLFKEVEITGIPYNSRTLHISEVTIGG